MYQLRIKDDNTSTYLFELEDNNINELAIKFNQEILNKQTKQPNNKEQKKTQNSYHISTNFTLTSNYTYLLKYFLLPINKINKLDNNYENHLIKLQPYTLLDLFTTKCLLDPYYILINVFNINEEIIYQTFVLYLNKTITKSALDKFIESNESNESNNFNQEIIINNFFVNSIPARKNIYAKLLIIYLKNKQILPFNIAYKPYTSLLNMVNMVNMVNIVNIE